MVTFDNDEAVHLGLALSTLCWYLYWDIFFGPVSVWLQFVKDLPCK